MELFKETKRLSLRARRAKQSRAIIGKYKNIFDRINRILPRTLKKCGVRKKLSLVYASKGHERSEFLFIQQSHKQLTINGSYAYIPIQSA